MKKGVIILGLIIVLAAVAFGLNMYAAQKIADTISADIAAFAEEESLNLNYAIQVSPVLRKVVFKNINFKEEDVFSSKVGQLEFIFGWEDFLKLLQTGELADVEGVKVRANNLVFEEYTTFGRFYIDELAVDYQGMLSSEAALEGLTTIPTGPEDLEVSIKNVKYETPEYYETNMSEKDWDRLTRLDEILLKASYNPESQTVSIEEAKFSNSLSSFESTFSFQLRYDEYEDIVPDQITCSFKWNFNPVGIVFGDTGIGQYTLDYQFVESDFAINWTPDELENYTLQSANISMGLYNFRLKLPDWVVDEWLPNWNIQAKNLIIDEWKMDCAVVEKDVKANSTLSSPALKAKLELDMYYSFDPYIRKAKLQVSELSESTQAWVEMFENQIGQALPREGKDIVLEVWGYLREPQIRGIQY